MAGEHELNMPGCPEEDTFRDQRFARKDPEVSTRRARSFPVPWGRWPLLLLLGLCLAICFLLLVTTLVQVSSISKSPQTEAKDPQENCSLVAASQDQVHSGLEQILQQLSQINASLARLCRPCPWHWEPFQGSCYLFSKKKGTWEASASSCWALGAQLVIINSVEEQRFLSTWDIRKNQVSWIGLTDRNTEGSWHWVDDSPLQLSFWAEGEPNNAGDEDCAELHETVWNDIACNADRFWICEQPVAPCAAP